MPLQKIGLNLSNLNNLSAPQFDIKNNTRDIINDIPIKANEITQGYIGLASLTTLFAFLMYTFRKDQIAEGDFGFDTARSIGIGAAICSIIGLYMINIGYFTNFYHVGMFIIIAFISTGVVYKRSL